MTEDYAGNTQYWYILRKNVHWNELRRIQLWLSSVRTECALVTLTLHQLKPVSFFDSKIRRSRNYCHTHLLESKQQKRRLKPFIVHERLVLTWNHIVYYSTFLWAAKFPRGTMLLPDFSGSGNKLLYAVSLGSSSCAECSPDNSSPHPGEAKMQALNTFRDRNDNWTN